MENKDCLSNRAPEVLQALIDKLQAELSEKDNLLAKALEENGRLRHQLNQLLQDKFGAKSEKGKNIEENTFDEAIEPDNVSEIENAEKEIKVSAHVRRKGGKPGRKPLPDHLP